MRKWKSNQVQPYDKWCKAADWWRDILGCSDFRVFFDRSLASRYTSLSEHCLVSDLDPAEEA
jgi:hypothetical protein